MENSRRDEVMAKELYRAAVKGDYELIRNTQSGDDHYLLRNTHEKNNVVHIAIRNKNNEFAEQVLKRFPHLLFEGNLDGNTPVHVAAEIGNADFLRKVCCDDQLVSEPLYPLRMKNSKGNTPLHVALIHDNLGIASFLVNKDPSLAVIVNDSMEAPLHLVIQHNAAEDYDGIKRIKDRVRKLIDGTPTNYDDDKYAFDSIITRLLEEAANVACWRDANGLTPLHRATLINKAYNVEIIELILWHCPPSLEVRDGFGSTILHHLVNKLLSHREGFNLFRNQEIRALVNHQDQLGNTALHMAVMNKDLDMMHLLLRAGAKLSIRNNEGLSSTTLIQQFKIMEMARKPFMDEEASFATENAKVFYLQERLEKLGAYFLHSRDDEGKNLLHKLFQLETGRVIVLRSYLEFIKRILKMLPTLICEIDHNGDTPVHVLARLHPNEILINMATGGDADNNYTTCVSESLGKIPLLRNIIDLCFDAEKALSHEVGHTSPWLTPNLKGSIPVQDAIIARNIQVLTSFTENGNPVELVNDRKETVLHLLTNFDLTCVIDKDDMMGNFIDKLSGALFAFDEDGLTPLVRAYKAGNLEFAKWLYYHYPSAAGVPGVNGWTFWHHLANLPRGPIPFELTRHETVTLGQLHAQDSRGNTPLHLALQNNRFDLAEVFMDFNISSESILLNRRNNERIAPRDLIASVPELPYWFERFLRSKPKFTGVRSMWGLTTKQLKETLNTVGVVAGLLTALTFTAAFTVPGGLNQEKGTPLLIKTTAFRVFIISDIVAMCLSVMVLISLFWIMVDENRRSRSVVMHDLTLTLLLASCYVTILTFMAGLYATLHPAEPLVAIFAATMLSLMVMLMHKQLVIKLIIPFGKAIPIFVDTAMRYAKKLGRNSYFT